MDLRFSLIGLIIGFLIGLTGMGGGALMTPIMILVMGVKPIIAVGTDLAYGAVTKITGGATHLRQRTVHRRTGYLLALGSVPASVLGVSVVTLIKHSDPELVNVFLLRALACTLIVVGVALVAKPRLAATARRLGHGSSGDFRDGLQAMEERRPWLLPLIGAMVGFLVGVTSVGSGTLIIASLIFLYPRWESKDLVGTDVFHAAMLVSASAMAQMAVGNVNVAMARSWSMSSSCHLAALRSKLGGKEVGSGSCDRGARTH